MNGFAHSLAAIPGPPGATFALDAAGALAPAGIALEALAILAAVVVLVSGWKRRSASLLRPRAALDGAPTGVLGALPAMAHGRSTRAAAGLAMLALDALSLGLGA